MVQVSEAIGSALITSLGCTVFLLDASSPANSDEFWARGQAELFLADVALLTESHDLFQWIIILYGTFRIDFFKGDLRPTPARNTRRFPVVLRLPTGLLVLRSPTASVTVLRVEPGLCDGALEWDYALGCRHDNIESVDEYPSDEGPDGVVRLKRIA